MIYLKSNITYLMEKNSLSKNKLRKSCGFAHSTVYRFFNTECMDMTVKTLIKLAAYFNVSIYDLVYKNLENEGH